MYLQKTKGVFYSEAIKYKMSRGIESHSTHMYSFSRGLIIPLHWISGSIFTTLLRKYQVFFNWQLQLHQMTWRRYRNFLTQLSTPGNWNVYTWPAYYISSSSTNSMVSRLYRSKLRRKINKTKHMIFCHIGAS